VTNLRLTAVNRALLRLRDRIQVSEETFHLLMAAVVGLIGGLVNVFFYYAIQTSQRIFVGHPGDPVDLAESLGPTARVLIPTVGGLVAGLILHYGEKLAHGEKGAGNILEAVVAGDGRIPFGDGLVKVFSSLVSIGSGGSLGREGGIVELSSTLSSKWGQIAKWPPYRLRILVACGAAAGIASAYNAPISGAVFAATFVVGNFSMSLFAPMVVSSVVATVLSRTVFGLRTVYQPPGFEFVHFSQLLWFLPLGLACGAFGALFLKLLRTSRRGFRATRLPLPAQLLLGGLITGLITLRYPGVWGNGQKVANRLIQGDYAGLGGYASMASPLLAIVGLLLAKLAATLATVGSGAVGGVFTPTLFLGASLGSGLGVGLHQFGVAADTPVAIFAMVGMAAMLAATTRAPLLAAIIVCELSADYSIVVALLLACALSQEVAKRLHASSVYTEPLRKQGLHAIQETYRTGASLEKTVGDVMQNPVPPVHEGMPLHELAQRFLGGSYNYLPVVDDEDHLVGLVALHDLKDYLGSADGMDGVIAFDIMRPPMVMLTPAQRLLDVLPTVLSSEQRNVPVVKSAEDTRLIGTLARSEVLGMFSEAIASGAQPAGGVELG
jgi:CIC family chloride channel protein